MFGSWKSKCRSENARYYSQGNFLAKLVPILSLYTYIDIVGHMWYIAVFANCLSILTLGKIFCWSNWNSKCHKTYRWFCFGSAGKLRYVRFTAATFYQYLRQALGHYQFQEAWLALISAWLSQRNFLAKLDI